MPAPAEPSESFRAGVEASLLEWVPRAAIVRALDPQLAAQPPCYVANGLIGASFDVLGFMNPGAAGRTALDYDSPRRGSEDAAPVRIPLAVIRSHVADAHPFSLDECRGYRQELDRLGATLTTTYDLHGPTRITAYAPRHVPNLFVYRIERTPAAKGRVLHLEVECETSASREPAAAAGPVQLTFVHAGAKAGQVSVVSRSDLTTTRWIAHCPGAKLEVRGTHIHVRLDSRADGTADHTLRIWVDRAGAAAEPVLATPAAELRSAHEAAMRAWWTTAWMRSPQPPGEAKATSLARPSSGTAR